MSPHREFPIKDCTAVILAGGESRRMKRDKSRIEVGGCSLLDKVISNLSGKFRDILLCVSENVQEKRTGVRIIRDSLEGHGPLSGIHSGLEHSETDKNFIIAADIPEVSDGLIVEMYRFAGEFDVVIPRQPDGKVEPLFGFYKKSLLPVIRKNLDKGENKVMEIYTDVLFKSLPMKDPRWFFNINTEEDLQIYRKHLASK